MIRRLLRLEAEVFFSQRYPYVLLLALLTLQGARMVSLGTTAPETSLDIVSAAGMWSEGVSWTLRLLYFMLLFLGAMGFSREFSLGTAKTLLVFPLARWQWYVAKLMFQLILAWGWLLISALVGWFGCWLAFDSSAVVREGVVLATESQVFQNKMVSLFLTAIFLAPLCAFALLLGQFFHNSGAAVGVAILAGLALEAIAALWDSGQWIFVHYVFQPLALIGRLGNGIPFSWESVLQVGLPVTLAWLALLVLIGLFRLEKMDIGNG